MTIQVEQTNFETGKENVIIREFSKDSEALKFLKDVERQKMQSAWSNAGKPGKYTAARITQKNKDSGFF
jgi:hypothetical protein